MLEGNFHKTAEHAMMAAKARLFGDEGARTKILQAPSPGAAKSLGRQVADFDEAIWEQHRFDVVVNANEAKFRQNVALGTYLINTGSRVLVEASPYDRIWGIGIGKAEALNAHP